MTVHQQIIGGSGSGKSRFMKQIRIPQYRARGVRVAVYDPLMKRDWGADYLTDDPFAFVAGAKQLNPREEPGKGWVLVVDEWPHIMETDPKGARELIWCYTVARNYGHLAYALGQNPMWVPKNVRRQCMSGVFFKDPTDAEESAATLGVPQLADCRYFRNGEAIVVSNGRVTYHLGANAIFPDLPAKDETPVIPWPQDRLAAVKGIDGPTMACRR